MSVLESTLEKIGRILSEKYGIRVVCRGDRCCTDGRTIYLPALPDDLPEDLSRAIHALLDHEGAHLIAKSDFKIGATFQRQHGAEAFGVLNCLEDLRVERVMRETFPGSAANLGQGYRFAHEMTRRAVEKGEDVPLMKQVAIAIATTGMDMPAWPMVAPEVYDAVTPLASLLKQAALAPSTKQVVPLAEQVWAAVRPLFSGGASGQSQPQRGIPPSKAQTPGGGSSPGNTGPPSGSDASSQTGGDAQSGVGPDATAQDTARHGTQSQKRRQHAQNDPQTPGGASSASGTGQDAPQRGAVMHGTGLLGDLGEAISRSVAEHAAATKSYRVWSRELDKVRVVPDISTRSHHDRLRFVLPHVAGVRQKLLQTLMADVRARWLPDTERGHLNPRTLHRLATARQLKNEGAGAQAAPFARRIFRQRVVTRRRDTAVTLLVDLSHSMANRKLDIARDTALALCEAMARLAIPVAVWGFSSEHHGKLLRETSKTTGIPQAELENNYRFAPLVLECYKRFDEPSKNVSGRFDSMRTHMLTPLGESMLFAARELAGRREERKVLLVLTDGRPTVGMADDSTTFLHARSSIVRIEKAGIDVALVGILENCVRDLHHRAVVVRELADLPGVVMTQLQRMLRSTTERYHFAPASAAA